MEINYNKIIEECRERNDTIRAQEAEDYAESVRERDLFETIKNIEWFKKLHTRKKITQVKISIKSDFIMEISKIKHYLRFFIDDKFTDGFYISHEAFESLTIGSEKKDIGSSEFYVLFDNQNK